MSHFCLKIGVSPLENQFVIMFRLIVFMRVLVPSDNTNQFMII